MWKGWVKMMFRLVMILLSIFCMVSVILVFVMFSLVIRGNSLIFRFCSVMMVKMVRMKIWVMWMSKECIGVLRFRCMSRCFILCFIYCLIMYFVYRIRMVIIILGLNWIVILRVEVLIWLSDCNEVFMVCFFYRWWVWVLDC